mgnify:CR=1 FL=1
MTRLVQLGLHLLDDLGVLPDAGRQQAARLGALQQREGDLRGDGQQGHDDGCADETLTRAEFFECLAAGFGLSAEAGKSKIQFLRELEPA